MKYKDFYLTVLYRYYIIIKMAGGSRITAKNVRLAIEEVRDIENKYRAKEKRFAELSKSLDSSGNNLQLQWERDNLSRELNRLGEDVINSEENLMAQLKENGTWKAKLIGYCWRSWRSRHY